MMAAGARQLIAIEGGGDASDAMDEIRLVSHEYLEPAITSLRQAADSADADAVRAYAYEVLVGAASIISACPRPAC